MKYPWISSSIALLLVFLVTGYILQMERRTLINNTLNTLTITLSELETEWTGAISGMGQMFLGFQHNLELMEQNPDPDLPALRRIMDSLVLNNNYMVSLVVTDAAGQVLHWTNSGSKPNLSERDYFNVHQSTIIDGLAVSAPLPSIMTPEQWVFGISKAVRHPDGSLNKVLVAIIDTTRLFRSLENLHHSEHAILTILSLSGDIYSRIPDHDAMVGKRRPELTRPFQSAAPPKRTEEVIINGHKTLLALRRLDCCQLYARLEIPLAVVLRSNNKKALFAATTGGIMTAILLWQFFALLAGKKREGLLLHQVINESQLDPLTGLPLFVPTSEDGLVDSDNNLSSGLILIGLDRFTDFVDKYGEQAGDNLIVHCGRTLKKTVPANIVLFRAAGSTFCFLPPGSEHQKLLTVAEQARAALASETFNLDKNDIKLEVSAGVTLWDGSKTDIPKAYKRASTALLAAREQGGNQIYWLVDREVWLELKKS